MRFLNDRADETTEILSPKFSGTNGEEYEKVCQNIARLFYEVLNKIEDNSHKIFAVHNSTWHDDMIIFRSEMRDLEIMIENLIATVFMDVNNVQEGIEDLRSFYNYLNRENLKSLFDSKNSSVRKNQRFINTNCFQQKIHLTFVIILIFFAKIMIQIILIIRKNLEKYLQKKSNSIVYSNNFLYEKSFLKKSKILYKKRCTY